MGQGYRTSPRGREGDDAPVLRERTQVRVLSRVPRLVVMQQADIDG